MDIQVTPAHSPEQSAVVDPGPSRGIGQTSTGALQPLKFCYLAIETKLRIYFTL